MLGLIMGLANFVGFFALMQALTTGPLSIIVSITGIHFVVAIALSAIVYRETPDTVRITGIGLTLISIILMKM